MSENAVRISYAKSLVWMALLGAIVLGIGSIVELVFVDFVHGNPHRSQANALSMLFWQTPIFAVVAVAMAFLIFTLPQCFQAIVTGALARTFGPRAHVGVLLALPLTAVITWYCYDYLTPSNFNLGINEGGEWTPYQHGLTLSRYLRALVVQAPLTLFSFLYWDATNRGYSRRRIVLTAVVLAAGLGGIWGHDMAVDQYQFIKLPTAARL